MKRSLWVVTIALCGASFLGAQAAQPASAEAEIRDMAKTFTAAANAKDAARIGALYAQDAVLMAPNQQMVRGRAAIQAYWQKMLDAGSKDVSVTTTHVAASGNVAYEAGTYQFTMAAPGAQPVTDRGKYVVGLRRDPDGKWRIVHDAFNSDVPCPPAAAAAHH
ncbi:MAG: SgcJ/EcaC family oxidoreductase [Thermoanaerobaculia bacterium]